MKEGPYDFNSSFEEQHYNRRAEKNQDTRERSPERRFTIRAELFL